MANNVPARSFITRHRTAILLCSLLLFLPPLALIVQATSADVDLCGSWCPRMFFAIRNGAGIGEIIGGIARSYMGVALVVGMLVTTVFFGRYWCSHLCPVGGATELGSRFIPRFLKLDFSAIPAAPVRYGYFAVYLAAPLIGIGSLCCNYCNFATIPRLFGAPFVQADMAYFLRTAGIINLAMIILLGFMARGGRAYCNFLCPIGALDGLASLFGKHFGKRVQVDVHRCNGCGECHAVCPTWAIEVKGTAAINQLSCMPCRECEKVCPEGAICYAKSD
jgi:polyferredoxin